jgi:magnesium-transporting ATPase (P-type)
LSQSRNSILHGYWVPKFTHRSDDRDFPSTAAAIARQCGIITNEKTDDFTDLSLEANTSIRIFDPEDDRRICKSIVLSGKDLMEMKDIQWNQVDCIESLLIQVMRVRGNCIC